MLKKLAVGVLALGCAAAAAGWVLSAAQPLPAETLARLPEGNATRGETVFWAGGCASCHAAPGAKGDDKLLLPGGLRLETPFGTFSAPNISSDTDDGIGAWTKAEFANAMMTGTAPDGSNYYPAFPYTSYARMDLADVADLFAYLKTLPAVGGVAPAHQLGFPFNIRRGLGLWKRLNLSSAPVIEEPATEIDPALFERGRYLVEGLGHCGECHTPRDPIGGLEKTQWLAGASAATGDGKIPNITPDASALGSWSAGDIAYYLESGFTPDYDSVGGEMVSVQENMARLQASDREAIAAYLKAVPPHAATK